MTRLNFKMSLMLLLFCSTLLKSQVITPFSSIYQTRQKGGIVFLSNSSLGCSSNPVASTGTCLVGALEGPLLGTTRNNNFSSVYIDVDGDPSTFMSSSDSLNLPGCSEITKVFLFWASSGSATAGRTQVKLKINGGAYQSVVANYSQSNTIGFDAYHCYADVTSLIPNSGNLRVTVADIPSSAVGVSNTFGSWNLVVVYKNDIMTMRQLTVFNGLVNTSLANSPNNIALSGFSTPALGIVNFEVGVYSHDGDRSTTGDNILFNGNSLSDLLINPFNDMMNSTVSNAGVLTSFRKPSLNNTMGTDADIFVPANLLNGTLANGATTATVQLASTGDSYLTQAITTNIETRVAAPFATLKVFDVNGGAVNPGDVLVHKIKATNIGSDASINTTIIDTLDANVTYVPNSTIVFFGPNFGVKTDAAGDDQVDYNAATRVLKIRVGFGANATNGGTVNGFYTGADSTVATYSVIVSPSCLKLACSGNTLSARASVTGTNAALGSSVSTTSSPGLTSLFGCIIKGTTTTSVAACPTPTASSSSPVCAGNTLQLNATTDPAATYSWSGPGSFASAIRNPTLSNVTTTLSGIYTVTLGVSSSCTAVASTSVTVSACPPQAVNDFTYAYSGVAVSANAASNDINALPGGTFAIITQPSSGTISINPATGQYTYTPPAGFTGATSATYQVCNGSPALCSTASISFTVFPSLAANLDVIVTTASLGTTGSLLLNDGGINPLLTYSIILGTIPPSTGTLTVDPATGQYTFIPNPNFLGNVGLTYTICTKVLFLPEICSTAGINLSVLPNPHPVNDAAVTVINVPVTGSASANDTGTAGATFTITGQPSGGTVTMNSSTGQFTFTPTNGFTGVTTATYNLCNSVPTCSNALITITVFPNVTANADVINTTPLTTKTGSLLSNDNGITTGASYSVTLVQPSASTGTLLLNSATGQYTFIPNAAFTGTVQTTYTVCNITVNPQQCSATTITISVSNLPIAVDDNISTVINVPVISSAATGDSGTSGGTFTFGSTPTGTLVGNTSTGQFTFTPATGFTGTTSTTYTLCNANSPPCSIANIIVTVFPLISANPDVINIQPGASTNGLLLSNDTGVNPAASYSVSFTQVSATAGTLNVNPLTGLYTFTANPAFTGSVLSGYTVCNIGVIPQQCSSTTIAINIFPNPFPVNDGVVTSVNIPVQGDAALNDLGVTSGSFAILAQPANGTVVINSTGQFTFTPAPGFTGVTTATYQLCNGAPASCSAAVISATVYPNMIANPDVVNTLPGAPATGSLLTNDTGLLSGASFSLSYTPLPPSTGTLIVDPLTGGYTLTPNPAFTGSAVTGYTICNTTVNPQQCSSTTIAINAFPNPAPVNDGVVTSLNIPVQGNAASNDAGVTGGVFSLLTQPVNGTVNINSATGQFTFTPATGFTGVTTATYQLCNGAPVSCSVAVISATVYPDIIANPDVVNTSIGTAATGTVLLNDTGLLSGAGFSLSYTQLPSSTGTLIVNPLTGEYTLTPNPTFTGSAATGYTLCNISVSPQQCSSTTLTLNVFLNAAPADDATLTVINVPVTGNASTNDGGTASGTFSILSQASDGTVTINSSTGQFTYTPSVNFTGVTSATYQLCNGANNSCDNAVITITVYPNVVANADVINTTPATAKTGSLLSNDTGISANLSYSVTVVQPAASTGTFLIDPATGHYTFTPNALFTGIAQTTYTVCNISVTPQQCSAASITINVSAQPVAANDNASALLNTPVSGNAATNDSGTSGGTFVFGATPTGTLVGNASTGQFTFTPATGFTGTTAATYTLCNLSSPPCSTASITFTIFPALVANPDVINVEPTAIATGSLLSNDTGISALGTYSVTYTQNSTSAGTLQVDPATGNYTFTPHPAFTGSTTASYTICNISLLPQQCSSATITINVFPDPAPADDYIMTSINVPALGNAASNDVGSNGGVFSIVTQPANGTITINPSIGQFTFTPAAGFTGVTTATYQLCNGAPQSCSTAVIHFTVFPDVIANNDLINTSPLVTRSGDLLTNDTGIIPGGTYSVTIAQPAASTGTIIMGSGGQYTFVPNALFIGTVQTTYTVCNTSINVQQCAVATITIMVNILPVAVNDATTTLINTPVTANAGTNDSGLPGTLFTFGNTSALTGTLTANAVTGQYTFTPAAGFTGTTSAGYTICTILSPIVCSSASITFTVYPTLLANADAITTSPNVTATGSLLTNDLGITAGGTYSTNVSALPGSTGTITVNSSTGQYTFIPNASFTGTAQTSYTVCNTGVTPQQCSSATITINMVPTPAPVNDGIATTINFSVTGNAATNDLGATGGTFAIVTQPTNGTVTINSSTGQFTFTPVNNFTGIITATYQLCNGAPVSCSLAVISVTVYPDLVANSDIVATTPLTVRSGSLLSNDTGIIPGGTYSVNVTQLPITTGTLVINAVTGQYTFTPNALFTGTTQTTYTVCNTGVSPQQCSSTTITIIVSNLPIAANDGTATTINTPVTGNVAGNDSGTLGGTFTFSTIAGATGTVTGNPLTGQYTFTPAAGFTGTTMTTYTLCNLNSPPCSTASITFTVYPTLVANPDVINTLPATATTGSLLSNDIGITTGATYTVSVTQLTSTTGTLTINPANGQYTFVPNPAFTGSVQTTYTVCNISVNPVQCSNTTITLNVTPNTLPGPVDDNISTTINTSVTANAAANDLGAIGGTFAIVTQPANGTISINPSTGQFTFTPAANFTGVTTATYQLCNGSPSSCSVAVISVTVYGMLVANPDLIVTPPAATATGSLLANDNGIITGGNYSVSITQLSAGTGTLIVNSTTGQYTFVPNPAFTGSAQTSYTVCNTAVLPQQCSSATITIQVGNPPVAVNDFAEVIAGTPVNGDVSLNDSHTIGGTFTFAAPNNTIGAFTGNPATGQYTFTPAAGFTGIASVAYTLCTPYSPPCSTALITFTVYPVLHAIDDIISTTLNTAVNGNLTGNDTGMQPNGSYSLALTPVAANVGTIVLNNSTGQYTFTPAANFTGSTITSYTLVQYSGTVQLQSSVANVTITVFDNNPLGVAKSISDVQYNDNSTIDLTYKLVIKNYGQVSLTNVMLMDNLSATFPLPTTYTVIGTPTLWPASSQLSLNTNYDGTNPIIFGNNSVLSPGSYDTLWFKVRIDPKDQQYVFQNIAMVSGRGPNGDLSDQSTNGNNPDPDGDGNPNDNSSPTIFTYTVVKIGIANYASESRNVSHGCYQVTFKYTVKNYNTAPAYNVEVIDGLDDAFPAPSSYTLAGPPVSANGYLLPNMLYDGSGNNKLSVGISSLAAGQADTLILVVNYCSGGIKRFTNLTEVWGYGMPGAKGFIETDISVDGFDPDPDGDSIPDEQNPTVFFPHDNFMIPQGFSPNNDGINDYFEIKAIEDFPDMEVSIMNRWGNLVYHKKHYDNSWNGKASEGVLLNGNDLPEGTYFYIIDIGNGQKPLKGYVYINRSVK